MRTIKKCLLCTCLLFCIQLQAQQMPPKPPPPPPPPVEGDTVRFVNNGVEHTEISPKFNGNFRKFLEANLEYPEKAMKKKIQGVVIIEFVIDKNGNVSDPKIAGYSPCKDKDLSKEAIRVIKLSSGLWLPGQQDGVAVKSYHQQSINFAF